MRASALAFLLCACCGVPDRARPGDGAPVLRDRMGSVLVLATGPCLAPAVLERLAADLQDRFHEALYVYRRQAAVLACWALMPEGTVHVVFEDGDVSVVPVARFKLEKEAR
jgi:hypothetical protein